MEYVFFFFNVYISILYSLQLGGENFILVKVRMLDLEA